MGEDTTVKSKTSLETVVAPWPIASNISLYLPVGDLICLSRTNIALRAALHGFSNPYHPRDSQSEVANLNTNDVREFINVGAHGTLYWERLKQLAPFECASKSHTKGTTPRPCRYCSLPICEACIVKDSMLRGKENTLNNRCRYFCSACWHAGNVSKSRRFPLALPQEGLGFCVSEADTKDEMCVCTLKNDAWLCIPCKIKQNTEATSDAIKKCHGQGCQNLVGEDHERRRVCNWCHKTLLRHLGGTARLEWTQKFIKARQRAELSRQADLAEYNRKRLKLMRMSRRQMRGDEAVKDDPEADIPQFVRHLDTFNYRSFVSESAAPSGNAVYLSKKGHWVYSKDFLKEVGNHCETLPSRPNLSSATMAGTLRFARSNLERKLERKRYSSIRKDWRKLTGTLFKSERLDEWHNLKPVILDLLIGQGVPFEHALFSMFQEHDFFADQLQYEFMFARWGYDWSQIRFIQDPYSVSGDMMEASTSITENEDEINEDKDLELAKRLQAQMDQESAEELQYTFFDANNSEAAAGPSTTQNVGADNPQPKTDPDDAIHDEAEPQISAEPSVLSSPISPPSSFSKTAPEDPTPPLERTDTRPNSPEASSSTARKPPRDEPPPYNPFLTSTAAFSINNTMQPLGLDAQSSLRTGTEDDNPFGDNPIERNNDTENDNYQETFKGKSKAKVSETDSFLVVDFSDSGQEDGGEDEFDQSCSSSENGGPRE